MNRRQWFIAAGVLFLAILLAFPLREAVNQVVILPAAYIWWGLSLFYQTTPQLLWWIALLVLVVVALVDSILPKEVSVRRIPPRKKNVMGPVESLAFWVTKSRNGIYFKWLIAHRLGKLAHQLLSRRGTRSAFTPLTGEDWSPSSPIQDYLEAGLHGSFADFPQGRGRFVIFRSKPTPLDHEIADIVEFLEKQTRLE